MKIGLIAMSGIRLVDEQLAAMGMTLPGVLERGRAIASMPSLGLLTLAGLTGRRHEVTYLEVPALSALEGVPGEFDMVAISTYSAQAREAYELAGRYRLRGTPVVMGGPHVSMLPYEAARFCDAVAIGEGEPIWLQIVDDCQAGTLKQFYGTAFSSYDMSEAPMPAFELLDPQRYNRITVQTSRGCPHRCEFCASSVLMAKKYKQKPQERVLAELDKIAAIWRHPFIEFVDDNAFVSREYWLRLLPSLKKRKLRWFAETDIAVADDSELLDMLAASGCCQLLVGLESPTRDALDGLEKVSNWKLKAWHRYRQAIAKIQSRGIRVIGAFVVGLDGHGPDIGDLLVDYVAALDLFDVQITVQTAFPGTELYRRLAADKRLIEPENWDLCTLFDVNYEPDKMSAAELRAVFRSLAERLYSEELTAARRSSFREVLRGFRRQPPMDLAS